MMTTQAQAAVAQDGDWERALEAVLEQTAGVSEHAGGIDLAFLFASASYGDDLLSLSLPGAELHGVRVTQSAIEEHLRAGEWYEATGVGPDAAQAWFVF